MKWTRGTQNDDVVDVRGQTGGRGTGAKVGIGGVAVLALVYIVSRAIGVDLTGLVGGGGGGDTASNAPMQADKPGAQGGNDPDAEMIEMIRDVMKDVQDTWDKVFASQVASERYRRAKLYIFRDAIRTKCGNADSGIGPFYCPGDENAYIDLSFYKVLEKRLDAPGDFAQVYVLAHEIGHHVQNILDADTAVKRARRSETENQRSVRIELQADCYAGVWGHSAKSRDRLHEGDIEEGLRAAAAIGDDTLQKQSGRQVNPESFSHGSSAQRVKWFRRGFDTGRLDACDTISGDI